MHPRAGILWKILSVALLRQGKAALPELIEATLLLPDDAEAQGNLGAALCDLGRWAEALPSLRRALALDPGNAQAAADAGNALFMSGGAEEALESYRRVIELDPSSADATTIWASAWRRSDAREEAVANYERALVLEPRHAEALDNLGTAWRELGDRRRAEALHRRALEIDPRRARSHHGIGSVQLNVPGSTMRPRAFAVHSISSLPMWPRTWGSQRRCASNDASSKRNRSVKARALWLREAQRPCGSSGSCAAISERSPTRRSCIGRRSRSTLASRPRSRAWPCSAR